MNLWWLTRVITVMAEKLNAGEVAKMLGNGDGIPGLLAKLFHSLVLSQSCITQVMVITRRGGLC